MRAGMGWLLLSVCCSSLGHFSLKLAAVRMSAGTTTGLLAGAIGNPWLLLGMALHITALGLWVLGLRQVELSIAYPFIVLGLVIVNLLSWAFLREPIGFAQWGGLVLIATGVLVIARQAHS